MAPAIAVAAKLTPIESQTIPKKSPNAPPPLCRWLLPHADERLSIFLTRPPLGSSKGAPCGACFVFRIKWIGKIKKQGAAGITAAAPCMAGQWGRGVTGCYKDAAGRSIVPKASKFFGHGFVIGDVSKP